tara:strand:+ start:327 stop:506 length:180 start_codon:yes stop_codon:yes gene_type:complete
MDLNKLQQKIQEFLKSNDLENLKDNYVDMATDDDFIEYYPLSDSYINSLDDSIIKKEGE